MKKLLLASVFLFVLQFAYSAKTIHVFVALCDNINQGIVKVPAGIGNGQDPKNNLYWGCGYGVKTFFSKSTDWKLVKTIDHPTSQILERLLFKSKTSNTYLLADAYDGAQIKQCTIDLLNAAAGNLVCAVETDSGKIQFGGASDLVAYTGHDGLMDFSLSEYPVAKNKMKRDIIILACFSKSYFKDAVNRAGANPLLWSTHLMSPEAYTLKAAIDGWIKNESGEQVRTRAAQAYNQYLKCGERRQETYW